MKQIYFIVLVLMSFSINAQTYQERQSEYALFKKSNFVAWSVVNAAPETVVAFDSLEIKWHNSSATSYDGIAIRATIGTPSINYTNIEFYNANAVSDNGKSV
jgi:hypothetical protein